MIFTPHQMSLGDEIKKNEKSVAHSTYVRETRCKQFLVEKPGGQRPLRRPRSIGEDNIKMDLQAHTDHSHDSRTTKWKTLTTEEPNGLYRLLNMGLKKVTNHSNVLIHSSITVLSLVP